MKEGDAVGAISVYVLPVFLLFVFMMAFINKTNAFDHFVEGAKEGMRTTVSLVPNIVGMIVAIKVFLASGIVDAIAQFLNPVLTAIHVDAHVLPEARNTLMATIIPTIFGTRDTVVLIPSLAPSTK